MLLSLRRIAVICACCLLASGAAVAPTAATALPLHRVLGQSTLTSFKMTLVATRGRSVGGTPLATVMATGYQRSGTGWRLIARKTVGKPNQWFWYTVEVCSLTVTQLINLPEGPGPLETATVSLLTSLGPGGCSKGYAEDWVVP
jgi:hypothetical protein